MRGRFERLLMEAIEEALSSFGEGVKEVVLFYCIHRHGVGRGEIPSRLHEFTRCLEEIFSYASKVVELRVASTLYAKLGLEFVEREGWRLVDYVEEARRRCEVDA